MRYGTPEYEALYISRGTPEKRAAAEKWRVELMAHIAVQHPHLNNREEVWKTWPSLENYK